MFERASKKLGLDHAVLSQIDSSTEKETDTPKLKPKGSEIDALLRNGAYGLFKDEEDDASRSFREADIDKVFFFSSLFDFLFIAFNILDS